MNKEEYAYNEAMSQYLSSKKDVMDAISFYNNASKTQKEEAGMSEVDYIRLTQLLQLAEKHLPKREIFPADQTEKTKKQFIFMKLLDKYRSSDFFKKPRKKEEVDVKKPTINSYILSEKFFSDFRAVRHANFVLKRSKIGTEASLNLDVGPEGELIRERREGPGILDDYRQSSWGVERICLDGMQNHLPNDAKGTQCWLHFLVDGKWVDPQEALRNKDKITKVRFADNGVGFTPDNLIYLHSTKTSEKDSVGQFGEGMKLASMASVNLGLGMELQSRNWSAIVLGEEKQLIDTRNNDNIEKRTKLVYEIKEYSGNPIVGSRTIFHTPTPEFIDYALKLPEKVLDLNPNYRPIFTTSHGDIVSTSKGGQLFVKGVYVQDIDSFFSYNFDDVNVNPDRNQVIGCNINEKINMIIRELNDKQIIKALLANVQNFYMQEDSNFREYELNYYRTYPAEVKSASTLKWYFDRGNGMPSLWRESFKEIFENKNATNENGEAIKAILKTDYIVPELLKANLEKYNIIQLYKEWVDMLALAGIETDKENLPEYFSEIIPTSLSLEYGKGIWGDERMVLDAVQNHLPADSGGRDIFIRFQTIDGEWHDFNELNNFADKDIKRIKIFDDGNGYDVHSLGLFASAKNHDSSSGKWGEGLKMLSAVALRKGYKIELRSRNWLAIPKSQTVILNKGEVNEKKVEQLTFETFTKVNEKSNILQDTDPYDKYYEKSSTTFIDPTPDLIIEFRTIKDKVLALQEKKAICKDSKGEVMLLDFNSGRLYVREILIPGNHGIKYGYHFKNFDIETRDRNSINHESLQLELRKILESTNNTRFISKFLQDAVDHVKKTDNNYLEFTTLFTTEHPNVWINTFKQDFGERTAVRKISDQDMNAVHMAQHLNIDMITLPDTVASSLVKMKDSNGQSIISYEKELSNSLQSTKIVPHEDLTDYEKFMINHLLKYNSMISNPQDENPIKNIFVYEYDSNYTGTRCAGFASKGNTININRTTLNGDLQKLGHVWFHEAGHAKTGAEDAEKTFRNFFTYTLSNLAMELIPVEKKSQNTLIKDDEKNQENSIKHKK